MKEILLACALALGVLSVLVAWALAWVVLLVPFI